MMQRALRTVDRGPSDVLELFTETDRLRDLTAHLLQEAGFSLAGDPKTIALLIDYAQQDVYAGLADWRLNAPKKKGRPANGLMRIAIQTAALYKFWDGVSRAEAAARAASFLGSPATKSTVDKAFHHYWRDLNAVATVVRSQGLPTSEVKDLAVGLVSTIQQDLDAIAEALQREETTIASSRKSARHARFFGAGVPVKVAPSDEGGDR